LSQAWRTWNAPEILGSAVKDWTHLLVIVFLSLMFVKVATSLALQFIRLIMILFEPALKSQLKGDSVAVFFRAYATL
jgi:hypothetical protein